MAGPFGLLGAGDVVEVFYRMPYGKDNGHEELEVPGDRWLFCATMQLGSNRPRIGFSERWLPATVVQAPNAAVPGGQPMIKIRWDVGLWFDWASGERIDEEQLVDVAPMNRVRPRSGRWNVVSMPTAAMAPSTAKLPWCPCGSELHIGGVRVAVSFIVFRWGAAKIPVQYDSHSWGRAEGSTVSARFIQLFFNRAVVPRLGWDYEVVSVFIQHSDEFASISPEFLASLSNGQTIVALYFLWPIQGQQTYGDRLPCTAAYVDATPFFDMVVRMEACGIVTRWPHHSQLWRSLASKDWVPNLCMTPKYHIPLTTRVPKSLILVDPGRAAQQACATMRILQAARRADSAYRCPSNSDWAPDAPCRCVAKLGFSYEGVDVRMCEGEADLADALLALSTQAGYLNDCVYVQQRVHRVDLEARCFVLGGEIVEVLYTRFARIDDFGYVRDYEKAHTEDEALREWFYNDQAAWCSAKAQMQALSRVWHLWMLSQAAEPTVSVRIDFMLERFAPGRVDVWTGEVGEQGYSMGGIDAAVVFNAVLDTISDDVRLRGSMSAGKPSLSEDQGG